MVILLDPPVEYILPTLCCCPRRFRLHQVELKGYARFSERGQAALSQFGWQKVAQDEIPRNLSAILPHGSYMVSQEMNSSFHTNPTFAHGFVVIVEACPEQVYFLSTDIDHPILE
jgi:hypothetical protein